MTSPVDREARTNAEATLPSIYRVDDMAAAAIAEAHALAASEMQARDGMLRTVRVGTREAAIAFRSERYLRVDDAIPADLRGPLSGDYRCSDGRWIRLHCNFEHHAMAAIRTLGINADRDAITSAVARWNAIELEEAVLANGGAAAAERSIDEWDALPHAQMLKRAPLVSLQRIGDAPARDDAEAGNLPMSSMRVLDLTRVIAGPVAGRTMAAYGADVLHIGARDLPTFPALDIDMGFGKRFAEVDLRTENGRETMRMLTATADIFMQSFRPGAIAQRGFSPEEVAALNPGIVYVSLSAYGSGGEWSERRGFDSLVQMATGITRQGAIRTGVEHPVPLPAQALDHATGWLAVTGALTALQRRRVQGGSWFVEVSLARTAQWLKSLGEVDNMHVPDPSIDDVRDLLVDEPSQFGRVTHVRFPGSIEGLDLQWRTPPHRQGEDSPEWLPLARGRGENRFE